MHFFSFFLHSPIDFIDTICYNEYKDAFLMRKFYRSPSKAVVFVIIIVSIK